MLLKTSSWLIIIMVLGLPQFESEVLIAVLTLVIVFAVVKLINYLFVGVLHRLAAKTKTKADDRFIARTQKPITLLAIFIGLHLGAKNITAFSPYYHLIDLGFSVLYVIIAARLIFESFDLILTISLQKVGRGTVTDMDKQILPILRNITKAFIWFVAFAVILSLFGYDVTALLAGLGVAGLAIALALQNTLSGFFAGFYLLADKPIRVGDYVKLASGEEGYIESIGWRSTRIRALKNYLIVVPNTKLAETIIYNYDLPQKPVSLIMKIGVDYNSDIDKVEKILRKVAVKIQKESEGTVKDYEPIVRFDNFSDYSLDFTVILRLKDYTQQWMVGSEFKKNVFKELKKNKIKIPFPTTTVYLEK